MTITAPFAYFGGKTRLADRIIQMLPAHDHYVEPYAGSLAVLLAKPRSKMETVNDLDGHLMTFWRVLRDQPDELTRVMALTPHSRAEFAGCSDLAGDLSDLERARRVWVLLAQGRAGTLRNTGWRYYADPAGSSIGMPGYLAGYVARVFPAAERLSGVSLECRPALEVIDKYGAHANALLYADPPYVGSTRSANYRYEMTKDSQHAELAAALHDCKAAVVLSGYHSPLYDDLYDGWHRAELKAWTGNGIRNGATKTDGDRVEVLWSNRPFPDEDLQLFGGVA
jgi:DNA adenine methylase